jgi:hypothetical protein
MNVWLNRALHVVAVVVGVAGTIAALPLGLPAVVVGVATKVLLYGGAIGVIAAKVAPGLGTNAPQPANTVAVPVSKP